MPLSVDIVSGEDLRRRTSSDCRDWRHGPNDRRIVASGGGNDREGRKDEI